MDHGFNLVTFLFNVEKRFGYSRTTLNYLRLLYWFLGEYYYSKIFDWRFTWLWILINVTCIVLLFSHLISYIFFSTTLELVHLLLVSDMIISGLYFMILIPLASYLYRKRTIQAFKILDEAKDISLTETCNKHSIEFIQRKKYSLSTAVSILITQFSCMACYIVCTNLDLFIGYTKSKLSDPSYYLYPIYSERVKSVFAFCVLLFSQVLAATPIIITYLIVPFFSIITVSEFHRKFRTLSDSLDHQSKLFAYYYEKSTDNDMNQYSNDSTKQMKTSHDHFLRQIRICAELHQNLLRGISHLKPYLEFNMSISIIMFMFFEILLLYTFILGNNDSVMPRIKSLNYAVIICAIFFVNCLTGKLFSDMEDMFREAVYNIPWYYFTTSDRKLVYLLLYRAHMKIEFRGLKIYSMSMELFLKFWQHVYSVVNVLRRVTIVNNT